MKTTGLNYLEAVKVLKEGKCTHIECDKAKTIYGMDNFGNILFMSGDFTSENGIRLNAEQFLGEWSLIGVKQKAVFTGVKWHTGANGNAYPTVTEWKDFQATNKPEMKMTLEWVE